MIKKKIIIIVPCVICCFLVLAFMKTNFVKAGITNNKPFVQKLPSNIKKNAEPIIKPTDTKKFSGNITEVQNYVTYLLTTSTKLPDDVKSKYSHTTPGTPLFIKDERDPSIDTVFDSYIVPLYNGNKIIGQCTVSILDGELAFSAISDVDDTSDSFFKRDYNKILDKIQSEKGIQIKSYQLVLKPDYQNVTGLSVYDPKLEVTTTDGKIFYYSNNGVIKDKSELDKYSSPSSSPNFLPGGN